jgi:N-acetylmuramoyl-L-alanine amidase
VSSQYVVYRDGSIEQWVDESDAAWHAGQVNSPDPRLALEGRNPNRLYIGIENEGFTGERFTGEMVQANLWLLRGIRERWGIEYNANTLIGHYRIDSINRARCPGSGCPLDWMISELSQGI